MKTLKLILFTIFISISAFSQTDTIELKLKSLKNDSLKCKYLLDTYDKIYYPSEDFIKYMTEAVKYAEKSKSKKLYADALKKTGTVFFNNGYLNQAFLYFNKAIYAYKLLNNNNKIADCYNYITNYYSYLQEYDKALLASKQIFKYAVKSNNKKNIVTAYRQTGKNYLKLGKNDSAYFYLKKALNLGFKINSKKNIIYNYSALGSYYFKIENYKQTIILQHKLLKLCNNTNEYILPKTLAYQKTASAYSKLNMPDSSFKYVKKMLYFKDNIRQYAVSLRVASGIYNNFKKYEKSLDYLDSAAILYKKAGSYSKLDNVYEQYIDIFLQKKDLNKVILYSKLRKENLNLIKQKRNKRQLENIALNSELKLLEKKTNELILKEKENKQKINEYKKILTLTSIILLLIILFIIFQIIDKKKIKKQTKEINNYKNNLEKMVAERTYDLIKSKRKAEESDKLKTEFLNNISHEVRTPLNAVLGFSNNIIKNKITGNELISYTKLIRKSGIQLLNIIDDIIEISKANSSKTDKVKENIICLNDILKESYDNFLPKINTKNINFRIDTFLQDDESYIISDKNKLNIIIKNLLSNAQKFTFEGYINLGYKITNNKTLEIYVKDTGIGINEKNYDSVFEQFYQEEKEIAEKTGGLGLGLAVAQRNAKLIGGKITFKSQKGKGSTFTLSIPYKKVKNKNIQNIYTTDDSFISKKKEFTILIAEDNKLNFLVLETMLKNIIPNAKIILAENGYEAVNYCKQNTKPDIILMDLMMPVMDGFEATKNIKSFLHNIPVIIQTAYVSVKEREKAFSAGCDDFISKPISETRLKKVISKFI